MLLLLTEWGVAAISRTAVCLEWLRAFHRNFDWMWVRDMATPSYFAHIAHRFSFTADVKISSGCCKFATMHLVSKQTFRSSFFLQNALHGTLSTTKVSEWQSEKKFRRGKGANFKNPEEILTSAVHGSKPTNRLGSTGSGRLYLKTGENSILPYNAVEW